MNESSERSHVSPLRPVAEEHATHVPESIPEAPRKERGGRKGVIILSIVVILAVIAAGTGFVMRQSVASDLSRTQETLATTRSDLASAQSQLAASEDRLSSLEAESASLEEESAALDDQVNACQSFMQSSVQAFKSGRVSPSAVNKMMNLISECYGKIPAWVK